MAIHENFQNLAVRLISKHGRSVKIVRDLGTEPADADKPWLGNTPITRETSVKAAFLDKDSRDLLLLVPGATDQQTLIEASLYRRVFIAAKGLGFEITVADKIEDGDTVWEIQQVNLIKPGPTPVVYVLKVSN